MFAFEITTHSSQKHQQWTLQETHFQIRGCNDLPGIDVTVEYLGSEQIRILNQGDPIQLTWHQVDVSKDDSSVEILPVQITCGASTVEIRNSDSANNNWFSVIERGQRENGAALFPVELMGDSPAPSTLARWFETLGALQCRIAGSSELMDIAVASVIQPGGLDGGMMLMKRKPHLRKRVALN